MNSLFGTCTTLDVATAKDKAVRFRVCQIVAGVLNALGPDAEVSDDLYERMEEVMLAGGRWSVPFTTNKKSTPRVLFVSLGFQSRRLLR